MYVWREKDQPELAFVAYHFIEKNFLLRIQEIFSAQELNSGFWENSRSL
jgi:hypothetical protein